MYINSITSVHSKVHEKLFRELLHEKVIIKHVFQMFRK